jgi:hypothetical protein
MSLSGWPLSIAKVISKLRLSIHFVRDELLVLYAVQRLNDKHLCLCSEFDGKVKARFYLAHGKRIVSLTYALN